MRNGKNQKRDKNIVRLFQNKKDWTIFNPGEVIQKENLKEFRK